MVSHNRLRAMVAHDVRGRRPSMISRARRCRRRRQAIGATVAHVNRLFASAQCAADHHAAQPSGGLSGGTSRSPYGAAYRTQNAVSVGRRAGRRRAGDVEGDDCDNSCASCKASHQVDGFIHVMKFPLVLNTGENEVGISLGRVVRSEDGRRKCLASRTPLRRDHFHTQQRRGRLLPEENRLRLCGAPLSLHDGSAPRRVDKDFRSP